MIHSCPVQLGQPLPPYCGDDVSRCFHTISVVHFTVTAAVYFCCATVCNCFVAVADCAVLELKGNVSFSLLKPLGGYPFSVVNGQGLVLCVLWRFESWASVVTCVCVCV